MIHDKIINLREDKAPIELYMDDNLRPISEPDDDFYNVKPFECPKCHLQTFGHFAPFERKGVVAWCSACNYTVYDRERQKAWLAEHPEDIETEASYPSE